ncbi:histidinol-phosphate aminotransferase family protein [Pseudomonas sp. SWRI102]|uniref:Aminotransferase n=1 Tax=Pseudomonas marvdashtae TaxID=2745500 RepID=A0A923JNF0_9PSED|nr:histidinol-phosphate transaminase [Pseudomonas marvdashtae]MBV4551296.1 histidinol-phosphate aminotransferase family protein [Pseudomonas marvdashtae]
MKINQYIRRSASWEAPERDLSSILLDLNENQFLDGFLTEFLAAELKVQDLFTYPNYQSLLAELADYCKTSTDNLLLTNGADQAIDLVVRLLFSQGDRVVIPSPVFSFYYQMLSVAGVEPVIVGFERQAQSFTLSTRVVLDALHNCQGLILCNPNNPLGVRIDTEQLRILIEACVELDKPLIVDECYFEYLQHTCLDLCGAVRQLFIIRSFSKYFGLAGLRLGYVVTHSESINELLKVRGPWDVNHVAVKAALFCLNNRKALERAHCELARVKREIIEFSRAYGIVVFDSETNFLLLEDQRDGRLAKAFAKANIRICDCSKYPHSFGLLENILRVVVPAPSDLQAFKMAIMQGVGDQERRIDGKETLR